MWRVEVVEGSVHMPAKETRIPFLLPLAAENISMKRVVLRVLENYARNSFMVGHMTIPEKLDLRLAKQNIKMRLCTVALETGCVTLESKPGHSVGHSQP